MEAIGNHLFKWIMGRSYSIFEHKYKISKCASCYCIQNSLRRMCLIMCLLSENRVMNVWNCVILNNETENINRVAARKCERFVFIFYRKRSYAAFTFHVMVITVTILCAQNNYIYHQVKRLEQFSFFSQMTNVTGHKLHRQASSRASNILLWMKKMILFTLSNNFCV